MFDLLVETLNTTDNIAVQVAILNALGSMGDARGVEVLTNLSQDKSADPYIQESAASALSRLEMVMKEWPLRWSKSKRRKCGRDGTIWGGVS